MNGNIQATLKKAQRQWMDLRGVVAVSRGKKDDSECIVIFVTKWQNEQLRKIIPEKFMGIQVDIRVAGVIEAEE